MKLNVVEIFESIQGEGGRSGELSIFIRLADCNLNCWFCDTEWSKGNEMTLDDIEEALRGYSAQWIVWTGGEPTLQLDWDIVEYFNSIGYWQAIETNGTNPVPINLDYVCCSPKVEVHLETLKENFPNGVSEFRYPVEVGTKPPDINVLPKAHNYFLSPIFGGEKKIRYDINKFNVQWCLDIIKEDPRWKFSLQTHKIIDVK